MAFVDAITTVEANYGTGSHKEEGLIARGGEYPSQLMWSDLHPSGKKVWPRDSGPIPDSSWIAFESTIGGKFYLAMQRLEGLMYALHGSRPQAVFDDPGYTVTQWWQRQHPRCLWGPENWEPIAINLSGSQRYHLWAEYAAFGGQTLCCPYDTPQVPIRSRSGDPNGQFKTGVHNIAIFPEGSVERNRDTDPFDPEGSGDFGAVPPGTGPGFVNKAGETVLFTYTLGSAPIPDQVDIVWRTKPPGGGWSSWTTSIMAEASGVYTKTLALQPHQTELQWYLKYTDGFSIVYDPGSTSAPSGDDAYYLQWYTHFQSGPSENLNYGRGLPELLDKYGNSGTQDTRRGTDYYEFDGSEHVQWELINLARFCLAWICGTTCIYPTTDDGCIEGGDTLHHNPTKRGASDDALCCVSMPIRWYWSGSALYPHYRRRGKGFQTSWDPTDTRPLTSHPDEPTHGIAAARKSWRGQANLWRDAEFNNPDFGDGYSWGQAPGVLDLWDEDPPNVAKIFSKFQSAGLQAGDVIDVVHIQEIIDAVDYIVADGAWSDASMCTTPRTPKRFMGKRCGRNQDDIVYTNGTCPADTHTSTIDKCDKCCENQSNCGNPGFRCRSWSKPTLEDCRDPCETDKCLMEASKNASICNPDLFHCTFPGGCEQVFHEDISCFVGSTIGCGFHSAGGQFCQS